MIVIELTQDEFENLLVALGVATHSFMRQHDEQGTCRVMRLANAVNRNNPNWTPLQVPERRGMVLPVMKVGEA
jgi:hypothetical protein